MQMDKVAILDCGGQYTKVIDRRVRELGVYSEIMPGTVAPEDLRGFSALILSGGPASVYDPRSIPLSKALFELGLPTLAICYGMQYLAFSFGGVIQRGKKGEYGIEQLSLREKGDLFKDVQDDSPVLMSHFDVVDDPGPSFEVVARTSNCVAAIRHKTLPLYGVQFHPEVDLTQEGPRILSNFLFVIAKLSAEYTLDSRIDHAVEKLKSVVGSSKLLVLVSGGVDSAVSLSLAHKALPDENIIAIHIDNGFMRKNESSTINEAFERIGFDKLVTIDAGDYFVNTPYEKDGNVYPTIFHVLDPELRRRIIGQRFVEVAERHIRSLDLDRDSVFLAQGTLRPDLIESGNPDVSKFAHTIKTHHNDVDLIRALRDAGRVIETNADWHKDEVRQVAKMLGLPESLAQRQPFPGPGLSIRMINALQTQPLERLTSLSEDYRLYNTGIQAVGVQGDERSYRNVAILEPLAARSAFDWQAMLSLARKFTNEDSRFNRVVVPLCEGDISQLSVHAKIHDLASTNLLREVDDYFIRSVSASKVSQALVVLLPLNDGQGYSIAIRMIKTNDFMTANAAVPSVDFKNWQEVADGIRAKFELIRAVFYDVTGKPPGTVEWL
ncbi:MAG: glutamine-hydrolyzing GMP synthase [Deltaproteobacteria bacterium]